MLSLSEQESKRKPTFNVSTTKTRQYEHFLAIYLQLSSTWYPITSMRTEIYTWNNKTGLIIVQKHAIGLSIILSIFTKFKRSVIYNFSPLAS